MLLTHHEKKTLLALLEREIWELTDNITRAQHELRARGSGHLRLEGYVQACTTTRDSLARLRTKVERQVSYDHD